MLCIIFIESSLTRCHLDVSLVLDLSTQDILSRVHLYNYVYIFVAQLSESLIFNLVIFNNEMATVNEILGIT
jgi:hypothetical protein